MKIIVLDRDSLGVDTPLSVLDKFGEVISYPSSNKEEVIARIKDADVIVINKVKITEDIMSQANHLKLICVFATGFDNIDIVAAKKYGIGVCNVPGYSTDSVAMYTVATVLALCSHLIEYNNFVQSGEYSKSGVPNRLVPVYHDIRGKKWGIIGYGNIGRAVADVARAFGAEIMVYKRSAVDGINITDIDTLCRESDIITIHCPLNQDSYHLINDGRISLMKNDVVIVNEARGAVVDENAIAEAVKNGTIGSFGCDVFTTEPFGEDHPFYSIKDMPNVLLTPHAAWGSYESRARCIGIIAENITSFLKGETLNRVDK